MPVLRVVSYNIHKGRSATGGRESLADLRLGLYGLRPDLLFLQEVQGRNQVHGSLDAQHESLAAALHMQAAYGCNAVRQATDHGNALLSRYPILYYENQDVSDHRLEQRGLLHGVVRVGDVPVHCLVVHLGLLAGGRSRQVQALADRIQRLVPAHEPLLIAGDFNDWTNRLAPLFVEQLGLVEVFAAAPQPPVTSAMRGEAEKPMAGSPVGVKLVTQEPVETERMETPFKSPSATRSRCVLALSRPSPRNQSRSSASLFSWRSWGSPPILR